MRRSRIIRTVVVDDEPLARERVRQLLEGEPDIEVVGEYGDGYKAAVGIEEVKPDLIFLDIQMPQLNGFELLETIGTSEAAIVFVTAYDTYALRAFEVHAVDYLLKPFGRERFVEALEAARAHLRTTWESDLGDRLASLYQELRSNEKKHLDRIVVKTGGRFVFVRSEQIDWIESAGNYLKLHCGKDEHLLRETMTAIETKLDPARFMRIHRSTMVNIERIKEIQPWFHGEYVVILQNGKELTLSVGYRESLLELQRRSS